MRTLLAILALLLSTSPISVEKSHARLHTGTDLAQATAAIRQSDWITDAPIKIANEPQTTDGPNALIRSITSVDGVLAESSVVFQSYRDNNWEIYRTDGEGAGLLRLTRHNGTDIRPRLNLAGTKVAFASDRAGTGFELYSMNHDGANVVRLTNNSVVDTMPAWSPDSNSIVFASNRNGTFDIFSMNVDGSGLRLLVGGSGDDLFPIFSPDGQRIAYVGNTGEYGTVGIIKPDGTPVTFGAAGSKGKYPEYPAWSKDSTKVAYSSDIDDDGLNELQVTEVDGSYLNAVTVFDPSLAGQVLQDVWMSSWSPNGEWLLATTAQYAIENNQVVLRGTAVQRISAVGGAPTPFPNTVSLDRFADWQWFDGTPPISAVSGLPQYSGQNEVVVAWSGQDAGRLGVLNYDVQVKNSPAAPWTNWLTGVSTTSAVYMGASNTTVSFRSRARDKGYNIENWSEATATTTTLYSWQLSSAIRDVREVDLRGSALSRNPEFVRGTSTTNNSYKAFLAAESSQQLRVAKANYGVLPTMTLALDGDTIADFWLPPEDDLIQNGQFESAALSAPWQASSEHVVSATTARHTGQYGLRLGQPITFTSGISLAQYGYNNPPVMDIDNAGTLHTVYFGDITSAPTLMYAQKPHGQPWMSATLLLNSFPTPAVTKLLADGTDALDVIGKVYYSDAQGFGDYVVHCRIVNAMTDCNNPTVIDKGPYDVDPTAVRDAQGGLHVVYASRTGVAYAYKPRSGGWVTNRLATLPRTSVPSPYPDLFIDPSDTLHLVFRVPLFIAGATSSVYQYMSKPAGGNWSKSFVVHQVGFDGGWSHVIADGFGRAYVTVGRSIYSIDLNAPESSPVKVRKTQLMNDWRWWTADKQGTLHLLADNVYWRKPINRAWFKMPAPGQPGSVLGPDGMLHIRSNSGYSDVPAFYAHLAPAHHEVFTASQAVVIPATAHKPTLSFVYAADDIAVSGIVSVSIGAAISPTLELTRPVRGTSWQHAWLDMSPWAGQWITVTFAWQQAPESVRGALHLDEVTLGSWRTPRPIQAEPRLLPAQAPSQFIIISGTNFIPTPTVHLRSGSSTITPSQVQWLGDEALRIELPANVPLGVYDVWVTNTSTSGGTTGVDAVLPGAILVGRTNYLPVVLRS